MLLLMFVAGGMKTTDSHFVSFASNLNLLLQDFYDGYFYQDCTLPDYCCKYFTDVNLFNKCRFERKFASQQNRDRNLSLYSDYFHVESMGRHPFAMVKYDNCAYMGSGFFYSQPKCTHRKCSSMTPFEFDHHYVTRPYICMSYVRYDDHMYKFYNITAGYKNDSFLFSTAYRLQPKILYRPNDFVVVTPTNDSVSQLMVCDDYDYCFMLSAYCASFLYWKNVRPSFFSMVGSDSYYNLTYLNYDPVCDDRHNFTYSEWPRYVMQFLQIQFVFDDVEDYHFVRPYLPYDLFRSEKPSHYRYLISAEVLSECNFTGYRYNYQYCGWAFSTSPNVTAIELHLPSALEKFKLSTWVTEFFDQLYAELEHIVTFILRITVETLVYLLKNLFRSIFDTLQNYEFFVVFDFCFLIVVFYVVTYDLLFSLFLSFFVLIFRYFLF